MNEFHSLTRDFLIGKILGVEITGKNDLRRAPALLPNVITQELGHISLARTNIQDASSQNVLTGDDFKDLLVGGSVRRSLNGFHVLFHKKLCIHTCNMLSNARMVGISLSISLIKYIKPGFICIESIKPFFPYPIDDIGAKVIISE
jgi:hypothetical protein